MGELDCSEAGGEEVDGEEEISIEGPVDEDELEVVVSDSSGGDEVSIEEIVEEEETEEVRSECAIVYLTVLISSSSGARKDTRFVAGNIGRDADAMARGRIVGTGLFERMEVRLCATLYGTLIVAESLEEVEVVEFDPIVDAELGVLTLDVGVVADPCDFSAGTELLMDNFGRDNGS